MATYNKRGYKAPKPEVENPENEAPLVDDIQIDEKDSTTAGVFNALDETASKTEAWVQKNQKGIIGAVVVVAVAAVGYLLFDRFVSEPKEEEAAEAMFVAQQNFQQAIDGQKPDSLFTLALKGSEGQFGFLDIAEKYSGTDAGNMANYYAGIAYLNTGKYTEAIESLDKFKAKDVVIGAMAIGAKADAFSEKNQLKEAKEYYLEAARKNANEFTTPMYLFKAAKVAIALNEKEEATKLLNEIKDNYPSSPEANNTEAFLGLAQ